MKQSFFPKVTIQKSLFRGVTQNHSVEENVTINAHNIKPTKCLKQTNKNQDLLAQTCQGTCWLSVVRNKTREDTDYIHTHTMNKNGEQVETIGWRKLTRAGGDTQGKIRSTDICGNRISKSNRKSQDNKQNWSDRQKIWPQTSGHDKLSVRLLLILLVLKLWWRK